MPTMPPSAEYELSTPEAAARIHVHRKTLLKWVRIGKVAAWRTPGGHLRFREADLDALIERGRIEADA